MKGILVSLLSIWLLLSAVEKSLAGILGPKLKNREAIAQLNTHFGGKSLGIKGKTADGKDCEVYIDAREDYFSATVSFNPTPNTQVSAYVDLYPEERGQSDDYYETRSLNISNEAVILRAKEVIGPKKTDFGGTLPGTKIRMDLDLRVIGGAYLVQASGHDGRERHGKENVSCTGKATSN